MTSSVGGTVPRATALDGAKAGFAVRVLLDYTAGVATDTRQPAVAQAGDLLHYANSRDRWERRSQGEGSKGQRYYDWAWFEVTLPGQIPADGFAQHLLIRRSTEKE
ncbi:hypothetical protein [Streptomyces sp. NPDC002088]|uniref:hypothetical protein n=1 Tax=Streptomyces sp. NPDC002088 TaxID=3154665 RepID=UPI003323152C